MPAEPDIYGGSMPTREGELTLEMHGMTPIPLENRYGGIHRIFTVWFMPNLVPAAFFIGVIAYSLGFWLGVVAIVVGTLLGAQLVAILCSWGPTTGVGQLPLARLQFGKTVAVPGLLMWLSTIAWDAINAIFGAEAIHLLIHVPFWVGLLIVLAMQGVLGIFGYEWMHSFEKWGSVVLGLMFVAITVKIVQIGNFHSVATVHGGAKVGAFILMVTIAASFVIAWGAYASDYSRYLARDTSRLRIALAAGLGLLVTCGVLEVAGAALATVAGTRWGISAIPTTQFVEPLPEVLVLVAPLAICVGAISANAINLYSSALSFLSMGVRIRARLRRAFAAAGFGLVGFLVGYLVVRTGQVGPGGTGGSYQNFLFFSTYWIAAFLGVVIADWTMRGRRLETGLVFDPRHSNWAGVAAFGLGVGACLPFMNQSLYVGFVASRYPQTGDLSFVVGFAVSAAAYWLLSRGRAAGDAEAPNR